MYFGKLEWNKVPSCHKNGHSFNNENNLNQEKTKKMVKL